MSADAKPRLTARQIRVLEFLTAHIADHGYPPSVREVGQAVGLESTSSVHHQLRTLERKGYIRRVPDRARALVVDWPR